MLNPHYKIKPITEVNFNFVPIKTVGLPFFKKVWAWRTQSRRIRLMENWYTKADDGTVVMYLKGITSDGSSIPRPLRWIDSPLGCSLTSGYQHDVHYRFRCILKPDGSYYKKNMTRFEADYLFRRSNVQTNDLQILANLMYLMLRLFGWIAWNQHRKHDGTARNRIESYLPHEDVGP